MSARDQTLLAAAALALVLLLVGGANRLMSFAVRDCGVGMTLLVRR